MSVGGRRGLQLVPARYAACGGEIPSEVAYLTAPHRTALYRGAPASAQAWPRPGHFKLPCPQRAQSALTADAQCPARNAPSRITMFSGGGGAMVNTGRNLNGTGEDQGSGKEGIKTQASRRAEFSLVPPPLQAHIPVVVMMELISFPQAGN